MTRAVSDTERRARLGRRHLLAESPDTSSPIDVARALTAIHGTDPASTVLGILARTPGTTIADVESALYGDRTLVRVLAMRRTVFAVEHTLAPAVWSATQNIVARNERRQLIRMLEASGVTDTSSFISEAEARALAFLEQHPGSTSPEIASEDPYLAHRLTFSGPGGTTVSQSVASRLLLSMSAEGTIVRGRPRGGWTSSQFTWVPTGHWRADWSDRPHVDAADMTIARSWLYSFGPGSVDDFAWWAGWPKGRSRRAIEAASGVEVTTSVGTSYLRADDLDTVSAPDPWVALLPGLDSTTMGWKQREFYLGAYRNRVFDNVGNCGPTVWVDGRIVGGWVQREEGQVAVRLFEDVGTDAVGMIERQASQLENVISEVRLKPRARRWTQTELELR